MRKESREKSRKADPGGHGPWREPDRARPGHGLGLGQGAGAGSEPSTAGPRLACAGHLREEDHQDKRFLGKKMQHFMENQALQGTRTLVPRPPPLGMPQMWGLLSPCRAYRPKARRGAPAAQPLHPEGRVSPAAITQAPGDRKTQAQTPPHLAAQCSTWRPRCASWGVPAGALASQAQ